MSPSKGAAEAVLMRLKSRQAVGAFNRWVDMVLEAGAYTRPHLCST